MRSSKRFLFSSLILLGIVAAIFIKGCDFSKTETIRVGYLPSLAASPLYAAIVQGYFEEEGLEVVISEVFSGPELINALQGRGVDISFGIVPPLIMARSRGIMVQSIAGATIDDGNIREHRLMIHPDSDIKTGSDLRGRTIAVVAEGTSDYFGLVQYLEKHGLTINDVNIVKTPHPDMVFAIASRSVDAACGIEPFISMGELQGRIKVFDYYYPDEPTEIGTFIATEEFIGNNPKTIEKFVRAIEKGIAFSNNHDKLREMLPTLEEHNIKFRITPEVANHLTIMGFNKSLTEKGVQNVMEKLIRFGDLREPIDVSAAIHRIN